MTNHQLGAELINLYHLARTALADQTDQSNWARMIWASKQFSDKYSFCSVNRAYKELSRMRDNGAYQPDFEMLRRVSL